MTDPAQDFDKMAERMEAFGEEIGRALPGWVMDGLDIIGVRTQRNYFIKSSRESMYTQHPDPNKLTSRGGALMKSYGPLGGAFSLAGSREGYQKVNVQGDVVTGIKGSTVSYAAIHEYGGDTHPRVTAKSRRFFWHLYYTTGNEKYKMMALTPKDRFTVHIKARPSLGPAAKESEKEIQQRIMNHIQDLINGRFQA